MMRGCFYSAVVCDALDAVGLKHQSPRVQLRPMTVEGVLIGRAKTSAACEQWARVLKSPLSPTALSPQTTS